MHGNWWILLLFLVSNLGSALAICLFRQPENRQNHNNVTLWVNWHQKTIRYLALKTLQRALYSFISLSLCLYILYSYFHNKFYVIIVIFYFTFIFSPLSLLPLTSLTFWWSCYFMESMLEEELTSCSSQKERKDVRSTSIWTQILV